MKIPALLSPIKKDAIIKINPDKNKINGILLSISSLPPLI